VAASLPALLFIPGAPSGPSPLVPLLLLALLVLYLLVPGGVLERIRTTLRRGPEAGEDRPAEDD
jgi:hypothetical protein